MPPSVGRFVGWPVSLAVVAACYVAPVAVYHRMDSGQVVFFWFATVGLVAVPLVVSPWRRWPALVTLLLLASIGSRLSFGAGLEELQAALVGGTGHVLQAVVAALVVRRLRDEPARLESQQDLLRLLGAAAAAGVLGVLLECFVLSDDVALVSPEVGAVFTARAISVLAVLPLALTLHVPRRGRRVELATQVCLLAAAALLVFAPGQTLPIAFGPIPLLVWGALRFDLRTVAVQLWAFAVFVSLMSAAGHGTFGSPQVESRYGAAGAAAISQGYLLAIALVVLPLAVTVRQGLRLVERLSTEEARFRRNFTESLIGGLFLRGDGGRLRIEDVNAAGTTILAADAERLRGRFLDEVLDTLDALDVVVERLLDHRSDGWSGPATVLARPGSRVELAVSALHPGSEDLTFAAQLLDVTTEHDARRRLEAAQKLTNATLDTAACVIVVTDSHGRIVRVNGATTETTGYQASELTDRYLWETTISPLDRADVDAMFMWPNRSGLPVVRERVATTKGGEQLRLVWSNNIVRDEHGLPAYAVLTGIDVTTERASTGLMTHLLEASVSTALIGIDMVGDVTVFNSGAQHLLGYSPEEMIGRPFVSILEPAQLLERSGAATVGQAFAALVGSLRDERETTARDWVWVTSSGRPLIVSMTLSLTVDEVNDRVGVLCVARDVTERRESQETLVSALETERTAVERLRELDEAKDEFVSTVSHELRTPVTSIIGYTEMLQDGSIVDADPAQLPLLETIARNGRRLLVICNDLLLISGLDSGSFQWSRDLVDLSGALTAAEESVRPSLAGRDLDLVLDRPADPVRVLGDRAQLDRVVTNLLSNAVKFTDAGGHVRVRVQAEGREAVITVSDTGIGIPVSEQALVFQRFYRTADAQHQAIPGTGLGLPIVAAIVEAHGGTIELDSMPGEGTVFTVRLPLAS